MKKIVVVMGGPSAEHDVSLNTGQEVLRCLDQKKYAVRIAILSRDLRFFFSDALLRDIPAQDFSRPQDSSRFTGPIQPEQSACLWEGCACAFLALHGEFGEDGRIQGFLETCGIPYTGSKVFASAVGMDKITTKYLYERHGLTTPPFSIFRTDGTGVSVEQIAVAHGFPCFVKCPQSGSSKLMGRADSRESLKSLLEEFTPCAREILIETMIAGEEYSVPVLEYPDRSVKALPPILIRPVHASFFDYTAKYTSGESEEIVPAPCSASLTQRLCEAAVTAHDALHCNGLSRTDILVQDGSLYVLETNTLPGLTSASLAPKAFAAAGGTYAQLLDTLIETALAGRSI
jgi:D-alanine-D-alanine ligase